MTKYSITAIKAFLGRDGHGFSANLLADGKKVATLLDEACGGQMRIDWLLDAPEGRRVLETAFTEFVRAEYERGGGHEGYLARMQALGLHFEGDSGLTNDQAKAEYWINQYVDRAETRKKLLRWCKTKTVFGLVDEPGKYRTLTRPYTPAGEQFIRQQYGERVKFVVNPGDEATVEAALA